MTRARTPEADPGGPRAAAPATTATAPRQVLALLDDLAAGNTALELSSALAQVLRRELAVVYIENTRSLNAAALPFTRVLSRSQARWLPFSPDDVEQGFRAQRTRLRTLAERIALRHRVGWSLRVVRGTLAGVALSLCAQADLLLLAGSPTLAPPAAPGVRKPARRPVVTLVAADDERGSRAQEIAAELARALGGRLETARFDPLERWTCSLGAGAPWAGSDVLVLAGPIPEPGVLDEIRCPVLLVG